ncbi:hypothetical protein K491DRAFT_692161 [Lophiostoma macrostomum CBS 122681]|uniref:Uncharacterized protein n=1 Tax=Lophiostoma macrostomum CBS 122681 TaxID=1314788 RepID=A0A6A6TCI4_9PLEO|nr:hypothetical protein K491DRAFT_692161 [Lophiostoma macrostomum CBS 122681]
MRFDAACALSASTACMYLLALPDSDRLSSMRSGVLRRRPCRSTPFCRPLARLAQCTCVCHPEFVFINRSR